ncbi:Putative Cytochrome oxidase assembly factor COX11 [Rhizopus microsporus]|nr:Putative Cytochrome oxidase assembly factor COX11 [Rhizopus microsporus]
MPSLRNAVQRRNHKERGQIVSRAKYGLLEKKKDYLLRAKDFHAKQKRLKALKEKALFRNPDEFYFKMINSQTKNGQHIQKRNEELPDEMIQLMKSQDKQYIKYHRDLKAEIIAPLSGKELKEIKKEREQKYKELASRMKREEQLKRAEQELELQRALRQKGRKKIVGKDKHGLDVYKWKQERKK